MVFFSSQLKIAYRREIEVHMPKINGQILKAMMRFSCEKLRRKWFSHNEPKEVVAFPTNISL